MIKHIAILRDAPRDFFFQAMLIDQRIAQFAQLLHLLIAMPEELPHPRTGADEANDGIQLARTQRHALIRPLQMSRDIEDILIRELQMHPQQRRSLRAAAQFPTDP